MATKKKLLQAAAGQAGGEALNVEDVFSTYLYTANNAALTITNGIDLAGEGGLVWGKSRSATQNPRLYDTEGNGLYSNLNYGSFGTSGRFTANSDGFDLTASSGIVGGSGFGGPDYASWTFRKAPKFFDVVTYTGTGSARTVSHNLGSAPGCIIVKRTDGIKDWAVYHRGKGSTHYGTLNTTETFYDSNSWWNDTNPTSTEFTVGTSAFTNNSGHTYVAYLFAHNDGDGDFGPTGDQDIIKCGSYTCDGSNNFGTVNLGFEPQFLLVKASSTTSDWFIIDNMRGMVVGNNSQYLEANTTIAEATDDSIYITPTGFKDGDGYNLRQSNHTYIYIAIRRGPMAVPESATDVFAVTTQSGSTAPAHDTGFVTDFSLRRENAVSSASIIHAVDRLRGNKYLSTEGTNAEIGLSNNTWDFMDGWFGATSNDSNKYAWSWKRAPNYFDVVAYTGNGTAGRTVSHNLGVAPEMIWLKRRDVSTGDWQVYHKNSATNGEGRLVLNSTAAVNTSNVAYVWGDHSSYIAPTSSVFTIGAAGDLNDSSSNYIAYLFASLAGVSKVGSVSHTTGSNTDVDCGFSAGARFVLAKRSSGTGHWLIADTTRGIVAGDDPYLLLSSTLAQITSDDVVDPYSSGFSLGPDLATGTWIYYAIA